MVKDYSYSAHSKTPLGNLFGKFFTHSRCEKLGISVASTQATREGAHDLQVAIDYGYPFSLLFKKSDLPAAPIRPTPTPPAPRALPVSPPARTPDQKKPECKVSGRVVVLVDVDNVLITARELSISVSFARLKEFVRERYGSIPFAEAFVSLHTASYPETVGRLCRAGFSVVACPMEFKDRDAVDTHIIRHAERHLLHTDATAVVVVSGDRDFDDLADFARDHRKNIVTVNPREVCEHIRGADDIPRLRPSPPLAQFLTAINALASGLKAVAPRDNERIAFVMAVIRVLYEREHGAVNPRPVGFRNLKDIAWAILEKDWRHAFTERDLGIALTALLETGVLVSNAGHSLTYYTVNASHPAVVRIATNNQDR